MAGTRHLTTTAIYANTVDEEEQSIAAYIWRRRTVGGNVRRWRRVTWAGALHEVGVGERPPAGQQRKVPQVLDGLISGRVARSRQIRRASGTPPARLSAA
jgi:hypothetical protein